MAVQCVHPHSVSRCSSVGECGQQHQRRHSLFRVIVINVPYPSASQRWIVFLPVLDSPAKVELHTCRPFAATRDRRRHCFAKTPIPTRNPGRPASHLARLYTHNHNNLWATAQLQSSIPFPRAITSRQSNRQLASLAVTAVLLSCRLSTAVEHRIRASSSPQALAHCSDCAHHITSARHTYQELGLAQRHVHVRRRRRPPRGGSARG